MSKHWEKISEFDSGKVATFFPSYSELNKYISQNPSETHLTIEKQKVPEPKPNGKQTWFGK